MNAVLKVIGGPHVDAEVGVPAGGLLTIGSAAESRLCLGGDPAISPLHAIVSWLDNEPFLAAATEGAFLDVDGRATSAAALRNGSEIRLSPETTLRYESQQRADGAPGSTAPASSGPLEYTGDELRKLAGTQLAHFRLDSVLCEGTSSVLFHAYDTRHDRQVVLKVLLVSPWARQSKSLQRFERAVQVMSRIRHPNLVHIYACSTKPSDRYCWVAMEYFDGLTLAEYCRQRMAAGMLEWPAALRIGVQMARGLMHAHEHPDRVVHRNFTPENVLLRPADQHVKITNFVLAKPLQGAHAREITFQGETVGELAYLPAELVGPEDPSKADERADIYSLGAVLYKLLTNRPPIEARENEDLAEKIAATDRKAPPSKYRMVPQELDDLLLNMLRLRPEDRPQSVRNVLRDMEQIAQWKQVTLP